MAVTAKFWHTAGMAQRSGFAGGRSDFSRLVLVCLIVAGILVGLRGSLLVAQDQGITTLHVYANTVQIPVLVLGPRQQKIGPIAGSRFNVSFDGGPPFRVSHVRPEGDDPISLAILLDLSGPEEELMPKISSAIAELAPLSLHPQDHVTVYALDCEMTRSTVDSSATPAMLKLQVAGALKPWTDRGEDKHGAKCQQEVHLWDALAFITDQLSGVPGRRVILAVTDGNDKESKHRWNEVRVFAQNSAVAIFGMSYVPNDPGHTFSQGRGSGSAFDSICELSGGLVFTVNRNNVEKKLPQFVAMVRGRYIVEFPRPYNSTRGRHELVVTIDKSKAFIRPTGISVPVADAKEMEDPTTVHSDPSLAPEVGDRHLLEAPQ